MNDRSSKNAGAEQKRSTDRWTLKRKRTMTNTTTITPQVQVHNPLFGVKGLPRGKEMDDLVKKSPSMNAMIDPTKKTRYQIATTDSDSGTEIASFQRKHFSRSTSVDSLHKIAQGMIFFVYLLHI